MSETFDFVIIGAGSAGCVLANRLSADPKVSVCLIEAGGNHNHWLVNIPIMGLINVFSKRNWKFKTTPQKGLNGRRGFQPRGKVLGGSSSLNAMIYIRGHKADYDHWAALGNEGGAMMRCCRFSKRHNITRPARIITTAKGVS